jgi:copper(I)-binding protein
MKKVLSAVAVVVSFLSVSVMAAHEVKVGDLKLHNPNARATVPSQKMSGGFLKIENTGAADKLAAIEVKLKGVKANTKPSNGRYSKRFHIPGNDSGCSL